MKITLNRSQWQEIGKTAGWMDDDSLGQIGYDDDYTPQPQRDTFRFSEDWIAGATFGKPTPNMYYSVQLVQTQRVKDDSDLSPTGHGPLTVEDGPRETVSFNIDEFIEDENIDGETVRNTRQIQEMEPDLYKKIFDYAEERAKRDGE